MGSGGEKSLSPAVVPLADAVAGLLELPLTRLSDDEVVDLLRGIEACARRLAAVSHRLLVEVEERSIPARAGARTSKRFLMETLRLSAADAGSRVAAVRDLGVWHTMDGADTAPVLPHTAAAQAAGEISADHARGIAAVMKRVPRGIEDADREAAEQILAEFARSGSPDDISKVGDRILAHLDPDGRLTDDVDRKRMRGLTLGRQRADGMTPIHGEITPLLRALLDPILAKFARPGINNPEDPDSPTGLDGPIDPHALADSAQRDHRSTAQRNHDALVAVLQPGLALDRLGNHRGLPVSAILTMSIDDVEKRSGVATTASGGSVPIGEALKLAEQAHLFLAVFDHRGLPLHLGRAKRLASPAQRLALIAALRGCSRPGCDAPATLTAVHHITDYARGGATDIDNETLACDHCHSLVHDGPGGWKTVAFGEDSRFPGRAGWIAPSHIDPDQIPRVNHRHHSGELLAETLTRIHEHNRRRHQQHSRGLEHRPQPGNTAA
ncbi:DUF222 domain-containing protein [Nocardia gipuzkoensis]|uniref:HNH endonuclease signature motif containing protein n=1 Tax=Nocardia gipuzkoensis TaxID=2749991 RepID=UPI003EE40F1A